MTPALQDPVVTAAPFASLEDHLACEQELLALRLERQVLRLRAQHRFSDDPFRGLYISDAQAEALLASAPAPADGGPEQLGERIAAADRRRSERLAATRAAGNSLPLLALAARFGLSDFEGELALLALAPEIDLAWETLYAYAQNDVTRRRPTVQLAFDLLCQDRGERLAHRRCLTPEGPLLRHRLLRLVDDAQDREPPLAGRYLRLEDRIADFLLGGDGLDQILVPLVERVPPADGPARDLHLAAAELSGGGVLVLEGTRGCGRRTAAAALAREMGIPLLAFDLARAVAASEPLGALLAVLSREARLRGAAVLIERFEVALADGHREERLAAFGRELAAPAFPLLLATEMPWEPAELWLNRALKVELPAAGFAERASAWRDSVLASGAAADREDLLEVAAKFTLSPREIHAASQRAAYFARARGDGRIAAADLHAGARALSRRGLARLAQKVETPYAWDDLILPRRSLVQLEEIRAAIRHRAHVHGTWGFAARLALGKGGNALFAGPSGTGKTMAASILARELGLDCYKVDLAAVVSKYIGETEKNLAQIFAEAERSNAVLFFDEADALFGKRSEVRDSHDRYANVEVAYLLQRIEEFGGIAILATNLKANLDEAFARRLHHLVDFPAPDRDCRERIWRRIFPAATPLADDVDLNFLARQFEVSGGNIRNIALAAAFLAVEDHGCVRMEHLVLATARELQKIGRLPAKSDFRDYYELIREKGG